MKNFLYPVQVTTSVSYSVCLFARGRNAVKHSLTSQDGTSNAVLEVSSRKPMRLHSATSVVPLVEFLTGTRVHPLDQEIFLIVKIYEKA